MTDTGTVREAWRDFRWSQPHIGAQHPSIPEAIAGKLERDRQAIIRLSVHRYIPDGSKMVALKRLATAVNREIERAEPIRFSPTGEPD